MNTHHIKGFSLLEMLCVCWLVAILSLIAYPSYEHLMSRSLQQEAQVALLHQAAILWQQHIDQSKSILTIAKQKTWPKTVAHGNYQLSMRTDTTGKLLLLAQATGRQKQRDPCSPWILNQSMQLSSAC